MKNTRGEPSAGGQTAPRETSLSSYLFIPCRSLHCGTRCKHSNYAQVAPSGRTEQYPWPANNHLSSYLCTSEEERALNTGFSPLFLATRSYICASLRFSSFYGTGSRMLENPRARFFNYANLWGGSCLRVVTSPAPCALCHRSSAG